MFTSRHTAAIAVAVCLAGCAGGSNIPTTPPAAPQQLQSLARSGIPNVARPGITPHSGSIAHPSGSCGTSLQFMSDLLNNAVLEYNTGSAVPCAIITAKIREPQGLAIDQNGVLYVANTAAAGILELKPPYRSVFKTLKDPGQYPVGVVSCGTYVAVTNIITTTDGPGSVSIYKNGVTSPSYTLQDPNAAEEFFPACDAQGNLYTSFVNSTDSGGVNVWHNHAGSATDTALTTQFPGGLVFSNNVLFVQDQFALTIGEATPPFNSYNAVIPLSGASDPVGLTISPDHLRFFSGDAGLNEGVNYDGSGNNLNIVDGLNPGTAIGVAYNKHY